MKESKRNDDILFWKGFGKVVQQYLMNGELIIDGSTQFLPL